MIPTSLTPDQSQSYIHLTLHDFTLYIFSVPRVFKGDYLDLKGDMKWRKVSSLLGDVNLVFADLIYKVNRADGKVCEIQGY